MTLFEASQIFVFVLITLIIITGLLLVMLFLESLIGWIVKCIKKRKSFNKAYPAGALFTTRIEQKFPYGKWKCLGKDQNDRFLYERIK